VWNEVAKVAEYTGAKSAEEGAYERIMLTDEDAKSFERFWVETASLANDQLKDMLKGSSALDKDYDITLAVSKQYDTVLTPSIEASLKGFFISALLAKWFMLANKAEAELYATESNAMMQDVMRKLYHRKRPTRVK
jgi:hypothetical protein